MLRVQFYRIVISCRPDPWSDIWRVHELFSAFDARTGGVLRQGHGDAGSFSSENALELTRELIKAAAFEGVFEDIPTGSSMLTRTFALAESHSHEK